MVMTLVVLILISGYLIYLHRRIVRLENLKILKDFVKNEKQRHRKG